MTATSPFHADGTQFAFDSSTLVVADDCLRKYFYRIRRGLVPKTESVHLIWGGIYASSLEQFYKLIYAGQDRETALLAVVREALTASHGHDFNHKKKTRISLIRSIIWYLDEFGDETYSSIKTLRKRDGMPAVELSFMFELSDDILLTGHLDRVVEFAGDKWVMDQKSTGSYVGANFFAQFDHPNIQMSLYSYAGRIVLNTPIAGVIVDAVQVSETDTRFVRGFTQRSPAKLEEFVENTLYLIDKVNQANRTGKYPMTPSSCSKYSDREGFGGCPFRSICTTEPSLRENFIKGNFDERFWNPLDKR